MFFSLLLHHLVYFIILNGFFAVSEVIFVITSAVKDVCGKPPSERLFLDKYGKICLCLDEIVWKVRLLMHFSLMRSYMFVLSFPCFFV